jgi:hypothetical protein
LSQPAAPPTGSDASVDGTDQDASEARIAWQAMVAARPAFAPRPVVGSKTHATILASTVREQALPLASRALYPPTVAGGVAAHPMDAPELYCFYRFCVPANRVPVQFRPWATPWPLYGTQSKVRNTARRGLAHRLERDAI